MASILAPRRWLLHACAVFVVAVLVDLLVPAPQPVYAIDARLVLTAPNSFGNGNRLQADPGELIMFAAAVDRIYDGRPSGPRLASPDATLWGMGVRDGSRVTLPDQGGQWVSTYDRPYLRVEVVSPSPEVAQQRFEDITTRLTQIIAERQRAAEVGTTAKVTVDLTPPDPQVLAVSGSRSRQLAAGVVLAFLAAFATGWLSRRRPDRARSRSLVRSAQPAV